MTLEQLLQKDHPPAEGEFVLSHDEFIKLFWKYKGLLKERERNNAFWRSTNDNLKMAYNRLDQKERELEKAYMMISEDLDIACRIQQSFLPDIDNRLLQRFEFGVFHQQLRKVGGDYYDFYQTKNRHDALGVFDISGHGVPAALIMAYLKSQFKETMNKYESPKAIIEQVNNSSLPFFRKVKKYATINFVLFEEQSIKYVCGGGYGSLLHGNTLIDFKNNNNFLGLRSNSFAEYQLPFDHGDILAIYTDGIIESQNRAGEDFSVDRLNTIIRQCRDQPVKQIIDRCINEYHRFRNDDLDDITLILMKKRGYV